MTAVAAAVLTVTGVLAILIIAEIFRELHTFKVTRYTVRSGKFSADGKELRIVFLSDLHNREYGSANERLYKAVRGERPDLILIGGDMLVGKDGVPFDPALQFVKSLPKICPVYYANGNHEQRMKEEPEFYAQSYTDYKTALEHAGIIFLENECGTAEAEGSMLKICGLELPLETYRKLQRTSVTVEDIERILGRITDHADRDKGRKRCFCILMAHNPVYMEAYKEWGADLILCGHLHGGIVRLPGLGGVLSPQISLFPRYSGELTTDGEQTAVVSRGLGTHTVNIRLFNTPEIVSITLRPASDVKKKAL